MGDGETVRRMPLGEGGRKKGDGGGGGGGGGGRRSVSLSLSVSPSPLDEAVIQPIKEAPQVANQAASGASFGRRRRTCRTCTAREKRKTERRRAKMHRKESESNERSDRTDAIQVEAPRCAIRAEHLFICASAMSSLNPGGPDSQCSRVRLGKSPQKTFGKESWASWLVAASAQHTFYKTIKSHRRP